MTTPQDTLDRLVHGYLDAVSHNLVGLPEDRRRELLADLADHIAAERAALDSPSEADIRTILDRLGDPVAVAAEARLQEGPPVWPAGRPMPAAGVVPPGAVAVRQGPSTLAWVLLSIALLVVTFVVVACIGTLGFLGVSRHTGGPGPAIVSPVPRPTQR